MTILLDKLNLYTIFNVDSFNELMSCIDNTAPSMTEYYLNDLSLYNNTDTYFNKSNIEQSLYLDNYSLYLDYNKNIYLEIANKETTYETTSLW